MPWPAYLSNTFNAIPVSNVYNAVPGGLIGETDESLFYGPYNTLLTYLFPPADDYIVSPLFRRPPEYSDWSTDFTTTFLVQRASSHRDPVFFLQIHPAIGFYNRASRASADDQTRVQFHTLVEDVRVPVLHGVSAMGTRLACYTYTQEPRAVAPRRIERCGMDDIAPAERWDVDVLSDEGVERMMRIANEAKAMAAQSAQQPETHLSLTPSFKFQKSLTSCSLNSTQAAPASSSLSNPIPTALPVENSNPKMPWPAYISNVFNTIPVSNAYNAVPGGLMGEFDESLFYGPYNALLAYLFPPADNYMVSPLFRRHPGDWSADFVTIFLVQRVSHRDPVFFLEIDPALNLYTRTSRAYADDRMRSHFFKLVDDVRVPVLHGVSAMGTRLACYTYTQETCAVAPRPIERCVNRFIDIAPAERWDVDVLSDEGVERMTRIATEVKAMVASQSAQQPKAQ